MSLGNVLHAVALCTTGIVFAGDGQVATLQTVGNVETLYTASYWSNGISPTNDAAAGWDYVAETGSVRMPEIANVFKCNSMTFGTDTKRLDFYAKTGTSTFENDGLHLVRTSSQCWTSGAMTLGGKELLNQYGVIAVNPDKFPDVNNDAANQFIDWITSDDVQQLIGEFGIDKYGQALFTPNAGTDN